MPDSPKPPESRRPRPLSLRKKVAFSVAATILFLAIAELSARATGTGASDFRFVLRCLDNDIDYPGFEEDPDLLWRMRPHADLSLQVIGPATLARTNAYGLRGPDFPLAPAPGERRILFLGDSVTFGLFLGQDEAFPFRVESLLNGGRSVPWRAINAGISGYTSFQGLRYFELHGLGFRPDLVVCCFGANDARSQLTLSDRELWQRARAGRLVRVLERSALFRSLRGFVKGAGLLQEISSGKDLRVRVGAGDFRRNLERIIDLSREAGARVVVVPAPGRYDGEIPLPLPPAAGPSRREPAAAFQFWVEPPYETHHNAIAESVAKEKGALFVPLEGIRARPPVINTRLFWDKVHPTAEGHRIMAQQIADALRASGLAAPAAARP